MSLRIDPPSLNLYAYDSNATIGTTERSIYGDTTTGVPQSNTVKEIVRVRLDLSALAAGDTFELRFYSKVDGGTQRTLALYTLTGTYSELFETDEFWLYDGFDITLKKTAGTDRAIRWAILVEGAPYYQSALGATTQGRVSPAGVLQNFLIKKDEATASKRTVEFMLIDIDGAVVTGKTLSGKISKNGGTANATTGTFGEVNATTRPGVYTYQFATGEIDTYGQVGVTPYEDLATDVVYGPFGAQIVAFDPYDAVRAGLTALPNAAAEAAGGLYTRGTGAGQINQDANGRIDTNTAHMADDVINATNINTDAQELLGVIRAATCQAGGSTTTVKLDASASATDDRFNGQLIYVTSGADGVGRIITDYVGATKVATVYPAMPFSPDGTYRFVILANSGALEDNGLTAAAIASNAITSAKIATDAIGSAQIAASAVTEIQSGLATSAAQTLLQADTDDIQSRLPAALVGGRMDSSVGAMANNVVTAASMAADAGAEIAAAVWAYVVENSKTALEYFRVIKSGVAGKLAVSGTTRTYRDDADTKDRITATVGATGRTAVTIDGT